MIPEFSYCSSDPIEDGLYCEGLFNNRLNGVVYTTAECTLIEFRARWCKEWDERRWYTASPTKLLIPGGLI